MNETDRERAVRVNRPTMKHLLAVVGVTRRSDQIARAALHEALTSPVCPERVAQLRRVTYDLREAVCRLEQAMLNELAEAPIVRLEDPPVTLNEGD